VMKRSDELDEVLAELRRQHQQVAAPPFLETRLRAAARSARPAAMVRRWAWAAAAAIILGVALWRGNRTSPASTAVRIQPVEITTEFIALPGSETLPAPLETSILRVRVPKGELRQYGFDVPPPDTGEMVGADFVVGDDGLARAVRLVR
jgi:hypothetical protein